MAPKHFVLIHDACHGKWIWEKLEPQLKQAGHEVTTFDLEASGDNPMDIDSVVSADQYTIPLLKVLEEISVGKVILVGHGFGGINAAIAMDTYPEKVERAVFLNALLPDTTNKPSYVIEQFMDKFHDWEDCMFDNDKITLGPTFVRHHLFVRCTAQDYQNALGKLKTGKSFLKSLAIREKFKKEGYGLIPRDFISSQKDTGIPTAFQNWEIKNFSVEEVHTIDGGDHTPMYSDQDLNKLLKIFDKIASK